MLIGITGGCGYVGFRLALALLRQSPLCNVRLLDVKEFTETRCTGPCYTSFHEDEQSNSQTSTNSHQSTSSHKHYSHSNIRPVRTNNQYPECIHELLPDELERLSFKHCDLTNDQSVDQGCDNLDVLYHIASYGMSGHEMMQPSVIHSVNVEGTKRCLNACVKHSINQLIYVSTYNVIFGDQPLVSVDETYSYLPDNKHFDQYSLSKAKAERLVLEAAGPNAMGERLNRIEQSINQSTDLRAIIIRPAAIYGTGESRHLPRILRLVQRGLGIAAIGSPDVLCDWIYIDNLVHGLIRAQQLTQSWTQLTHAPHHAIFALSDDHPVNNFMFLGRLIRGLGYESIFLFYVPTRIMFALASGMEWCHRLVSLISPKLAIQPFLTRAEVCKVGITHFCSVKRAKQQLGWTVIVSPDEAIKRCIAYYTRAGFAHKNEQAMQQRQLRNKLIVACILVVLIALIIRRA